jgi:hypothetical protein
MADIRPIPYSVGQYEAQVFDLSGMTRVMAQQQAAQRKAQQEAKKEIDKLMANTYAAKGKGRLQDMPELEKQYEELQNYYINNNSSILKGGKEFLEFQKKRSDFIFEAEQASLRKERDKMLMPYFSTKAGKDELSEDAKNLLTVFNLPYNDQRRKDFTYMGADGQMHGIDELNLADVEKYTKFDEAKFAQSIQSTVKDRVIEDVSFNKNYQGLNTGLPLQITGRTVVKDPYGVAERFTGAWASTPDTERYFSKRFNSLTPEEIQQANEEFKTFNSIYKAAGLTNIVNTENDKTPGISNAFEYGLYTTLKQNLPQDLGERVSTSVASLMLAQRNYELSFAKFRRNIETKPIEQVLIEEIRNVGKSNFNGTAWSQMLQSSFGGGDKALGGVVANQFNYDKTTGKMTVITQKPLLDANGQYVYSFEEAQNIAGAPAKKGKDGQAVGSGFAKKFGENIYYYREEKVYNLDPTSPTFESEANGIFDQIQGALPAGAESNTLQSLRKQPTIGVFQSPGTGAPIQTKRNR